MARTPKYDVSKPNCFECSDESKWVVEHGKYACENHIAKLERKTGRTRQDIKTWDTGYKRL